jgi:hypothetical protein
MRVAYVLTFDPSRSPGHWGRLAERLQVWRRLGVNPDVFVCVGRRGGEDATDPGCVAVAHAVPTVLEVHADDTVETKLMPWSHQILTQSLRRFLLSAAAGVVYVDPQLPASRGFAHVMKPSVTISNGVMLGSAPRYGRTRERLSGPPRLLLVVGSDQPWQGVDRFLALAALCPDFDFHLVGDVSTNTPCSTNVHMHGVVTHRALEQLHGAMDVGVGNLALERIDRRRASPLKVREYIRQGLPIILAHNDPDLDFPDESILNLGLTREITPTLAARVGEFVLSVLGKTCTAAVANAVNLEAKETARVAFFRQLIGGP